MKYRSEIDGLRALAVIPVLLFHAGFSWFKGGYVGVDVFFVISGFLITSIIIDRKYNSPRALIDFYMRRIRRIVPVLYLIILLCIPLAMIVMLPYQILDLSQSVFATTVFSSNILFFIESGYFDIAAKEKPLLHTWSLAVEEQFYIFYPIIMILIWRLKRVYKIACLAFITIVSFALAEYLSTAHPEANFFLLPSRAWELSIGCLIAFFPDNRLKKYSAPISVLGLSMIALSVFTLDSSTPYPSSYTLFPVLGTALILLTTHTECPIAKALSIKPLVFIGLLSYSLYLWHQPLFAYARIHNIGDLNLTWTFSILALTGFLSFLGWKFLETPIRKGAIKTPTLLAGLGGLSIAFLCFGFIGHKTNGYYDYYFSKIPIESRARLVDVKKVGAEKSAYFKRIWNENFEFSDRNTQKILILGDSFAGDIYAAAILNQEKLSGKEFKLIKFDDTCYGDFLGKSNKGISNYNALRCKNELEKQNLSAAIRKADLVVLTNHWEIGTDQNLALLLDLLETMGKKTLVLSADVFQDIPSVLAKTITANIAEEDMPHLIYRSISTPSRKISQTLEKVTQGRDHVKFVNRLALFCNHEKQECTAITETGHVLFYDFGHFTMHGLKTAGEHMIAQQWFDMKH